MAGRDLAGILPWSESEIQTAIEELDRSTAAIAKQTETLKQQQEALARLVKANVKNQDARADLELRRAQRRDAERKRATAAVGVIREDVERSLTVGGRWRNCLRRWISGRPISSSKVKRQAKDLSRPSIVCCIRTTGCCPVCRSSAGNWRLRTRKRSKPSASSAKFA